MELKDVGQRIAKLRKENGWSQMELSEKLNVSDKTVSKWENGGMPGIDLFPKMAKLFNVSIDYLMTGSEDPDAARTSEGAEDENASFDMIGKEVPKSEELPKRTEEKKVKVNLPENYVCPKCGKVNPHPDTNCAFCYHKFIIPEENGLTPENDNIVTPEDTTSPVVCPKCNRVNSNRGTHCMYCYHDFSKNTVLQKANMNKRGASDKNYFSKYSSNQSYGASATTNQRPVSANQAGCLAYLLAFLFPLIGLIWGASKHERGVTVFSGVLLALRFISVIIYLLAGLVLLGV